MQQKPRVYLSKSKQIDLDTLLLTRKLLSAYNIELVEFSGGEYTTDLLESCDILLVLPTEKPKAFNYSINVGKGNYTEIVTASEEFDIPIFCILIVNEDCFMVSEYLETNIIDIDWKRDYATVECVEILRELTHPDIGLELLPTTTKSVENIQKQSFISNLLLLCK